MSSLHPVTGSPAEVLGLLRAWNDTEGEPPPLVVQTSGSTGEAKRVMLSRSAMRASATATAARLGGPGQWLLTLPPTYVAGLQVLFRSVLAETEPVLLADDFGAAAGRLDGERRFVSVVPTQLHRMLDRPELVEALASLTTVLVGGAEVPDRLRARAADAGIGTVATYGMSETCGGCVYDGVPLDGVAVKVDAEDRVLLAGPVLFDGYGGRPDLTGDVLRDGWFRTQDLGRLDEDGRLEILGRADDVVISGGANVPTAAVAARLCEHPSVADACVVGVPDAEWGQRVVALVVGELSLDEARDWVSEVQPRAWAPRDVHRLDAFPLLDNGKVDLVRLRDMVR